MTRQGSARTARLLAGMIPLGALLLLAGLFLASWGGGSADLGAALVLIGIALVAVAAAARWRRRRGRLDPS
ncbi:hypothetical protein GGQ22_00170 [Nocardioides sp. zg-579]|uniref:Uncharacterized protein n=1 Tax=Nocardioides marmotae TaxID=2663857 RepID=A0A6I3J3V9_9ACTN|nr:hypothetical protein [Nocardioides marmotae]MCR6029854.1 hypothetical protein [Gordonia jinghuaiqii]MTB93484.1 hypothetical protein [Nocardioides marmotae]QKD99865.1 hypothetical protein HPC71_01240 [Nocardioides marmotae]